MNDFGDLLSLGGITYAKQALKLKEGKVQIPLGAKVKVIFNVDAFSLPFPTNLDFQKIREIKIVPRNRCFYIEWVYKLEGEKPRLVIDHCLENGIGPIVFGWN